MPSDRRVCFVCGSFGVESRLNIKLQERGGPYFPFLENHDPPKGALLPGKDGVVDSCRVCHSFLISQWEAYERTRTPPIKRLYWLKRSDNGHFTGAEMRLQGEYIAQIMGLQYQPLDEGNSPTGAPDTNPSPVSLQRTDSRRSNVDYPQATSRGYNTGNVQISKHESRQQINPQLSKDNLIAQPMPQLPRQGGVGPDQGVLDLSVTKKTGAVESSLGRKQREEKIESKLFQCYLCLRESNLGNSKLVNTCRQSPGEPYFPVLGQLPQAGNPHALNKLSQARVCMSCKNVLYQQWQAYEMSGVPVHQRTYKLYDDSRLPQSLETALKSSNSQPAVLKDRALKDANIMKLAQSNSHVCYLCGHVYPEELIQPLFTVPPREASIATLFFPFIRDLQRPQGAHPLKSDGTVLGCRSCFAELYQQWQQHEVEKVPIFQRRYSLSFLAKRTVEELPSSKVVVKQEVDQRPVDKGPSSSASSSDISQPLNIQISESSVVTSQSTPVGLQGLLTIAPQNINPLLASEVSDTPVSNAQASWSSQNRSLDSNSVGKAGLTIPHPLEQATSMPQRTCFLCGEHCKLTKLHILCSYPTRHEAKAPNNAVIPFFPFLANQEPAPGAESMSEEGTVITCDFCYQSLLQQWNAYEESNNPSDSNRWLRKYTLQEVVCCYVCGKSVKRKNFQTLSKSKFPFLKDHLAPTNVLILEGGDKLGVCNTCRQSLLHQYAEFERMGVPSEMRKYNWIQASQHPTSEGGDRKQDDEDEDDSQPLCVDENSSDSNSSNIDVINTKMDETAESAGLGQGSKPPPLTMISPAGTKLSRNTATVPPLNQVSPSNGVTSVGANAALNATRTSSFAAALRKLANQAKDPEDGPSNKHSTTPGSSSTSPRAHTPKRGPPPLVYTTHSSSISSPPVVTIAPTQSHTTVVSSDGKQSLERSLSVHSTTSSLYESLKQERERPQSTHSNREDDRLSSKDLSASSRRPHSGHSSTSPATNREELARGFQPYRPGDDLRHQLPPAFGLDPAAAYSYPAFLPPHFPHPAFRFDDPVMLERYRMMQPQYLPFAHPGMIPPPGVHPFLAAAAGGRYPTDFLHQQFPQFAAQASRLPEHISPALSDRQRLEEERQRELEREKERERDREREKEREALHREKERAREREKEFEKEKTRELYYSQHHLGMDGRGDRSKDVRDRELLQEKGRTETDRYIKEEGSSVSSKFGSIMQGTPREQIFGDKAERDKVHVHPFNEHLNMRELERERYARNDRHFDERNGSIHRKEDKLSNSVHSLDQAYHKNMDRADYEKRPYSLLFSEKPGSGDKDRSYQKDSNDSSMSHYGNHLDLSQKNGKDSSFFRPFDTQILTNGFNGSHVSEYEKYSSQVTHKSPSKAGIEQRDYVSHSRSSQDSGSLKGLPESYLTQRRTSEDLSLGKRLPEDSLLLRSTEELQKRFSGEHRNSNKRHLEEQRNNTNSDYSKLLQHQHQLLNKNSDVEKSTVYSKPHHTVSESSTLHYGRPLTSYSNRHHNKFVPSLNSHGPSQVETKHVVSRLDICERKLREKRAKPDYCSEESDAESDEEKEDEHKIDRLLFISNVLPLELDTSKPKMKFLNGLGLTSKKVKKELEFRKYRKRRRLHREQSPVQMMDEESGEETNTPALSHVTPQDSEALCHEPDYPDKCAFFGSMELNSVSPEKRKEHQYIRKVCEEDRLRRLGILPSSVQTGIKGKSNESNTEETSAGRQQLKARKEVSGDGANCDNRSNHHHRHKKSDKKASLFSGRGEKSLSLEFAQEFHESVLQTTRQRELNSRLGLIHSQASDAKGTTSKMDVEHSGYSQGRISAGSLHRSHIDSFHNTWPGIEIIMDSYQKHMEEQAVEKSVLLERCQMLKKNNQELHQSKEFLKQKLQELKQNRQQLNESRTKCQDTIDSLKKRVRDLR